MSITQIAYWLMLGVGVGLVIGFLTAWLTVARAD
jgi:hypothetical protein